MSLYFQKNFKLFFTQDIDPVEGDILEHHFIFHLHQRSSEYSKYLNVLAIRDNLVKLMDKVRKLVEPSGNEQVVPINLSFCKVYT